MQPRRPPGIGTSLLGGSASLAAAAVSNPHSSAAVAPTALDAQLASFRFVATDTQRCTLFYRDVMKMHLDRVVEAGAGASARVRTTFMYPADRVSLRFEFDAFSLNGGLPAAVASHSGLPSPNGATVVVYVDDAAAFVSRLVERPTAGTLVLDVHSLGSDAEGRPLRGAVLMDPSGLRVRLLEGSAYALPAGRSRGRLAYVSLPVADADKLEASIAFFEGTLGPKQQTSAQSLGAVMSAGGDADQLSAGEPLSPSSSPTSPSHAAGGLLARKASHFRLVDLERFVSGGLATFAWMSNGSRRKYASLCLVHKVVRGRGVSMRSAAGGGGGNEGASDSDDGLDDNQSEARKQHKAQMASIDRKLEVAEAEDNKLFLGLAFSVPDIDQAVSFLRSTELGGISPLERNVASPRGGSFSRFGDLLAGVSPPQSTRSVATPATAGAKRSSISSAGSASGSLLPSTTNALEVHHLPGFPRFLAFMDPSGIPVEISDGATMSAMVGSGYASYAGHLSATATAASARAAAAGSAGKAARDIRSTVASTGAPATPSIAARASSRGLALSAAATQSPLSRSPMALSRSAATPRRSSAASSDDDSDDEPGLAATSLAAAADEGEWSDGGRSGKGALRDTSDSDISSDDDSAVGPGAVLTHALQSGATHSTFRLKASARLTPTSRFSPRPPSTPSAGKL